MANERHLYDPYVQHSVPDFNLCAVVVAGRYARHSDRSLQCGRKPAAGYFTLAKPVNNDTHVIAQYAFVFQDESGKSHPLAVVAHLRERPATDELAVFRIPRDRPG